MMISSNMDTLHRPWTQCAARLLADMNRMLHIITEEHSLPTWKKLLYEGRLLEAVRKAVRKATQDAACDVHLEGSVLHGDSQGSLLVH